MLVFNVTDIDALVVIVVVFCCLLLFRDWCLSFGVWGLMFGIVFVGCFYC